MKFLDLENACVAHTSWRHGKKKKITKYTISAEKHKDEYDFYDAESVVTDFLSNVKKKVCRQK